MFIFHLVGKKGTFRSTYPISSIIVACETAYGKWPTSRTERAYGKLNIRINLKFTFTPIFFVLPVYHFKARLVVLHPVKLFLNFGHYAAPNPYNYVAALVLNGTQGSVRGRLESVGIQVVDIRVFAKVRF